MHSPMILRLAHASSVGDQKLLETCCSSMPGYAIIDMQIFKDRQSMPGSTLSRWQPSPPSLVGVFPAKNHSTNHGPRPSTLQLKPQGP